jgi:transcriptional/translational regulatory protein YebC/TACO1
VYGPDVGDNPQLAATVNSAKKAGVPKAVIEAAIARGQGRSADGARLEAATYEIMMPPSVALIVDLETESKARALQDLNALVRRKGGSSTSTKFFFARRGRVVFGLADHDGGGGVSPVPVSADDILEDAIEAGAEDIETDDDGNIVVWTPANQTAAVVAAIAAKFKTRLAVVSADTIWSPNEETRSAVGAGEDLRKLAELLTALRSYADVRAIYSNAARAGASDDVWQQMAQDLDW